MSTGEEEEEKNMNKTMIIMMNKKKMMMIMMIMMKTSIYSIKMSAQLCKETTNTRKRRMKHSLPN